MRFTKMQGIGNDYVYVNCLEQELADPGTVAINTSDRHFGIGSDGLVLICPSEKADFRMEMFNADGSQAQMCGNAIRCVGKFVYDKKLTDKTTITIETLAGIKTLELYLEGNQVESVRVNMGSPEFAPSKIPIKSDLSQFIQQPVEILGNTYNVTGVSVGNPHAITFMEEIDALEIKKIGPAFETHSLFPEGINTEFVRLIDDHTIQMRVWERGSGETLACGTGACAAMVAAHLLGFVGTEVDVMLRGGTLHIQWNKAENCIYMTGPCVAVFEGEINI